MTNLPRMKTPAVASGSSPAPRSKDVRHGIAHDLGVAIVSGELLPGMALLSEERYSAENGVSRGAYREALRILAAKGLIQNRLKSTTLVNDRSKWSMLDLDVLDWMFEGKPSRTFVDSIFELRGIVEPSAAGLAAIRRTDRELAQMGHALEEMERYGLRDSRGRAADQTFHLLILSATRNEPLATLSNSIAAAVEWTTRFARDEGKSDRDPMPDHHAVFAALATGDAKMARRAMEVLIDNALSDASAAPL